MPLEVICGCMYSGKSEEMQRRIRRAEIARLKVVMFKHTIDDRYPSDVIYTHSGQVRDCIICSEPIALFVQSADCDVIGIDEIQFYDERIIPIIQTLVQMDKTVIVSGLDMTYRAEPFGIMPHMMAIAEKVDKLTAICHSCGSEATRTQRLLDGKPAPFDGPTVLVGASEAYEARCLKCFEPG